MSDMMREVSNRPRRTAGCNVASGLVMAHDRQAQAVRKMATAWRNEKVIVGVIPLFTEPFF